MDQENGFIPLPQTPTELGEKILESLRVAVERDILTRAQVLKVMHVKGRATPDLPQFTFPGSGITVRIRRLGPFTLDAIGRNMRAEIKAPEVPKVMVNYGDDERPDWHMEENIADPDYKQSQVDYERKLREIGAVKAIDTIIKHAIIVDVDDDEVASARALLIEMGVPNGEVAASSDHEIYVKHVCIKTAEDLQLLQSFVIGESVPAEERVRLHEDSFRGEVSREAPARLQGAPVGDEV